MNKIKGTKTEKNLLKAFAGESQARNRYTYAAKVAKKEGFVQIAELFLETAEQEKQHAKRFFRFLEGGNVEITASYPAGVTGTTKDNLRAAAAGEYEEHTVLYPEFARIAKDEGFPLVAAQFNTTSKAEEFHEKRYRTLLDAIENDRLFKSTKPVKWVCRECGYIHEGTDAPEICACCEHPRGYFQILNDNN